MNINRDRITVDPNGNWRVFLKATGDRVPMGTVRVGTNREGALLFDNQLDAYVMIDGDGRIIPLEQRKVRAALGLSEPVGAPRKGYEVREVYGIRLEPSLAKYLRDFGNGNLSEGVTKVGEDHRERSNKRVRK